tara:strand:+ start:351 stop:776 length:426 start_codon:yes stop_codon:yes gene_type:complete
MSTVVATNINTDALVGSASANAITVRGEGSATTSLQQGLVKCWAKFDGEGTVTINDSFNVGGLTDNGNGDYSITITNDFANVNYAAVTDNESHSGHVSALYGEGNTDRYAAGIFRTYIFEASGAGATNSNIVTNILTGDLA